MMNTFKTLALSILVGIIFGQCFTIYETERKLSVCTTKLSQAEAALTLQNQAVLALKKESEYQEKEMKAATQKADIIREQAKKDFNSVMTAKIPADCKEAVAYGVLYVNSHQISAGF